MEVRKGYKQAEVGVIPEEWECKKIEYCASITTGSKNTEDKIDDGLYPFFVRSSQVERINTFSFDCEAVLTAGDGVGTGKVYHYINGKFDVHQRVYVMTNFRDVTGRYFYNYFSNFFYNEVCKYTAKSSVDSVRRDMIAKMFLPIPPLPEQQAIATALSDIDGLINSLTKLIDKKKNIKRGAMQELLTGKKRLEGFSGEWKKARLGDIAEITMGQSPDSKYYNVNNLGLPLVQGNADIEDRKTIIRFYTSEITRRGKKDDIIMTVRAPVGSVGRALFDCCLGRGVCSIRYANEFLYHYLVFVEADWGFLSRGSTFDSVNSTEVKSLELIMPFNIEEQTAIANILSDMDAEIEALERKLNKYKSIKQGMMQELLTGRIRLV